jgi:hypothetical protein
MPNVLIKDGQVIGLTELNELKGYEILPAPKGFDGNLERLRYRKGKLEVISEEDYLKEKKIGILRRMKRQVSKATERYISTRLEEIDEDLSDLATEIANIEARLLLAIPDISSDEVKKKTALFMLGEYTEEQAIKELQDKGLNEEQIKGVLDLLARAVEIAKIIAWKEKIWEMEEHLEEKLEKRTLDELENLKVEEFIEEAYKEIVLDI